MCWTGKMPFDGKKKYEIKTSDDFKDKELDVQWQWNYQPRTEKFSLRERKGWLRLKAFKPLKENRLLSAGNTLTQRCFRTKRSEVTVKMDISGMADGQRSGLCHFSSHSGAIGLVKDGDLCYIEYRHDDNSLKGPSVESKYVWLKSEWSLDGKSKFYYSIDGNNFIQFGDEYQLCWGYYRGDRLGLYCFNDKSEDGYVDIDFFNYKIDHYCPLKMDKVKN